MLLYLADMSLPDTLACMATRSQTELAVLGGLSIQPMSGYALRAVILDTLGHFWHESYGQIYPTIRRLLDEDLVVSRESPGGRPEYGVTESGRIRLTELLSEPVSHTPPRDGLLLRLFFGEFLGAAQCRELLLESRGRTLAKRRALAAERADLEQEAPTEGRTYRSITLAAGESSVAAHLAWIDESLAALPD